MIPEESLDSILLLQLAVARLGEKPLRFWWNSDIADVDGGADLLSRLVGTEMAPLAVMEGLFRVAAQTENHLLSPVPLPQAFSLFCPPPDVRKALHQRFRHFKTYPDELPDILSTLATEELSEVDVIAKIEAIPPSSGTIPVRAEKTSFGMELTVNGVDHDPVNLASALAAMALQSPRGSYTLSYFRGGAGG